MPLLVPSVVYVDADRDEKSDGGVWGMVTAPRAFAGDSGGLRVRGLILLVFPFAFAYGGGGGGGGGGGS